MVLATRCPNCGTSFRVVPDQLKLRGGWVRCGVCSTTFDSNTSLTEVALPVAAPVDTGGPALREPARAHHAPETVEPIIDHPAVVRMRGARPAGALPEPFAGPSAGSVAGPDTTAPLADPPPASGSNWPEREQELSRQAPTPAQESPLAAFRADRRGDDAAAPIEPASAWRADREPVFGSEPASEFLVEPTATSVRADARSDREPSFDSTTAMRGATARAPGMVEPSFVIGDASDSYAATPAHPVPGFLDAHIDAKPSRWRMVWRIGALLALSVLLGQAVVLYRTDIATRFPVLRPLMEQVCAQFACTVAYPRDLRQLSIESSSLESWDATAATPPAAPPASDESGAAAATADSGAAPGEIDPGTGAVTPPAVRRLALNIVLRNRAKFAQPWPSFELSLTDFSETVVARRVLLPSAYLAPQQLSAPLPAGAERSLRIPIETSDAKASGYRVAVFFP